MNQNSADSRIPKIESAPRAVGITTDAAGNLASDNGRTFRDIDRNREGVALAIALDAPHVALGQRFAVSGRWGGFEGADAVGINGAFRFNQNFQLDAGVAFGVGNNTTGATVGGTISW